MTSIRTGAKSPQTRSASMTRELDARHIRAASALWSTMRKGLITASEHPPMPIMAAAPLRPVPTATVRAGVGAASAPGPLVAVTPDLQITVRAGPSGVAVRISPADATHLADMLRAYAAQAPARAPVASVPRRRIPLPKR